VQNKCLKYFFLSSLLINCANTDTFYGGGWSDCKTQSEPYQKVEEFIINESERIGFSVTILDSTEQQPLYSVAVWYKSVDGIQEGEATDINGSVKFDFDNPDTLLVSYIGFDSGYYYRSSEQIDSVVIYLPDCLIYFD